MKPRVLYFAIFVFFSLSGGRFTATFLEHELQFTENWMVTSAMAVQLLSSSLCSSWLGGVADSWEATKGGKNKGRLLVMSLGLLLSTSAMLLHSLGSLWMHWNSSKIQQNGPDSISDLDVIDTESDNSRQSIPLPLLAYHLFLRALFAVGTAGVMPVLDGLTLSQLDREGRDKQEYGKERVYGAISWGMAHIILGPAIDRFGFKTLYVSIILSFIGCMITFQLYAKSNSTNEYIGVSERVDGGVSTDGKKPSNKAIQIMKQPQKGIKKSKSETCFEEGDFFDNCANSNTNNAIIRDRLTVAQIVRLLIQKSPILNISYVISLFALYIGMSVVEQLIFLYFEFLGGTNTMCGLTVIVTVIFELPLFHFAPNVAKWLGSPVWMLQWGCVAYVVRVLGYSLIPQSQPYWVLFLEPLHGITIAFALTSSVAVADTWVPRGYEASGQGFLSMIRGLGMFVGFCIAGVLEGRTLYQVLAGIVSVGMSFLAIGSYYSTTKPQAQYISLA